MKLKAYRNSQKKTQLQCAIELELSEQYYSQIERGVKIAGKPLQKTITTWSGDSVQFTKTGKIK